MGAYEALRRVAQAHPDDHDAVLNLARTEARHRQKWRTNLYRLITVAEVWVAAAARLSPEQLEALQSPPILETPYATHEGETVNNLLPANV